MVGASSDNEEEKMLKIITVSDIKARNDGELKALFYLASNALTRSDRYTQERRQCLSSLFAIQNEINRRGSLAWVKSYRP